MTRARYTLAIAASALAFTACGGGGDGGGNNGQCDPTAPSCTGNVPPTNSNKAPTAEANGPYASVAGGSVSFSAAGSSDPEDQPSQLKYEWDFGDGSATGSGAQVSHVYTVDKTYTARLKVTDTKGATASDEATVTITKPATTNPPAGATVGTLGIVLTDAPFPFDAVGKANMFVARVDARFTAPTTAAELQAAPTGDPNTGWVTVATPGQTIDLLTLQGGRTRMLGSKTDMPTGTYSGFRVVLDVAQSNLELKNGTRPSITWGGSGQVAYAITPSAPVTLAANGVVNVLVDFDLGRSFNMLGATPAAGFEATPSLRTVLAEQTGVLLLQIYGPNGNGFVEGASIEVLAAGTTEGDTDRSKVVATGGTNAQGSVQIAHLVPGSYPVRITPPAGSGLATTFQSFNARPGGGRTTAVRLSSDFELLK